MKNQMEKSEKVLVVFLTINLFPKCFPKVHKKKKIELSI